MATKKNNYINADLDWAEEQLAAWRAYIDDRPMDQLKDREGERQTKFGPTTYVISSIEQQGKFIQETMKNYLALLEVVNKLREGAEAKAQTVKGEGVIPHRMVTKEVEKDGG